MPLHIHHPWWMLTFLVLTAVTFSLFGFIIGIWADGFEKLQMIPMLVVTPLTFLGGSFYSVNMLPSGWRTITLLNPVVYLISRLPLELYEIADVSVGLSVGMTIGFLVVCMVVGVVDLQDRLPAEELTRERVIPGRLRNQDRESRIIAAPPNASPVAAEMAVAVVIAAAAMAAMPAVLGIPSTPLTAPMAPPTPAPTAPPTTPPTGPATGCLRKTPPGRRARCPGHDRHRGSRAMRARWRQRKTAAVRASRRAAPPVLTLLLFIRIS